MSRPNDARQAALRLWLQLWDNQRRCAEAVRQAQQRDRNRPHRQTKLLTYADSTLGRPLVTADNRLIIVSWSSHHPRGRISEVPLDLDRKHIAPEEWLDLVPDDGKSVIRDVAIVDCGPDRHPLLAISRTHQGAAEAHLYDPATGRGTPIPLAHLGLPGVHAPDGRQLPGVFGQITGMTATVGSDGGALEIEHSSIVSAPRTFRIPFTPHGPRDAAEIPREDTVADRVLAGAKVTRHNFLAPDGTPVRGLLVDRDDAPGAGPLMFTSYSNFFVGNNTSKLWNDVHSTHVAAGGRLWINEERGTGSDGYRHFQHGVRDNQFGAVMDVVAGIDHILENGIAEPGTLHASAQSAGPLIMLRAVAQRPGAFAGAVFRRPVHDLWRVLETGPEVAHEYAGRLPNMSSCHYLDPGTDMPGHTIVIGAPDDPRIHDAAVVDLFSQLATTTTEPLLRIARPGHGVNPRLPEPFCNDHRTCLAIRRRQALGIDDRPRRTDVVAQRRTAVPGIAVKEAQQRTVHHKATIPGASSIEVRTAQVREPAVLDGASPLDRRRLHGLRQEQGRQHALLCALRVRPRQCRRRRGQKGQRNADGRVVLRGIGKYIDGANQRAEFCLGTDDGTATVAAFYD
ncbi:alpha/beta hydrolase family protein [Streptodolium elevatio]